MSGRGRGGRGGRGGRNVSGIVARDDDGQLIQGGSTDRPPSLYPDIPIEQLPHRVQPTDDVTHGRILTREKTIFGFPRKASIYRLDKPCLTSMSKPPPLPPLPPRVTLDEFYLPTELFDKAPRRTVPLKRRRPEDWASKVLQNMTDKDKDDARPTKEEDEAPPMAVALEDEGDGDEAAVVESDHDSFMSDDEFMHEHDDEDDYNQGEDRDEGAVYH